MASTTITDPQVIAAIGKAIGQDLAGLARVTVTVPKTQRGRACACGCETQTAGGTWAPGHDAKHKSALFGVLRGEASQAEKDAALAEIKTRGWPQPSMPGSVTKGTETAAPVAS